MSKAKTAKTKAQKTKPAPPRQPGAAGYGRHYYCVEIPCRKKGKSESLECFYFYADRVTVKDGTLLALSEWPRHSGAPTVMLALQSFEWSRFYAANSLTGEPLVVDLKKA